MSDVAATAEPKGVVVKMKLARATPGALRYEEVGVDGLVSGQPNKPGNKVGTLYTRKGAFPNGDEPQEIVLTITY
jgi:hypothetical protein